MYSQFKPGQSWTPDTSKLEGIDLNFKYYLSLIGVKGNMAYEYNPLHNYRLTLDTDSNGLHPQEALLTNKTTNVKEVIQWKGGGFYKNGQLLWGDQGLRYENADKTINGVTYSIRIFNSEDEDLVEGGTIVDLDTEHLNFSLNNPVEIEAQPSYDGSVNLILNDNRNIPRLINTRFTTRQLNTYEVVDRIGDNDTNLYDDSQFDLDTSLYKRVDNIPVVNFNGVLSFGNLKVGNYTFYFKYADADGNETDFVEQSGIISIFKGNDKDPFSIDGGIADMLAYKSVSFTLSNIDLSYDYVKVYYTRSSSDLDENAMTTAYEINKKFVVRKSTCRIIVTGEEAVTDIPLSEINVLYFLANRCRTQAQCQNRLFLANLTKPDIAYQDLTDISLRILPYLSKNKAKSLIGKVDTKTYKDNSTCPTNFEYYNTQNIYYHVGYWNEEMYRLGIVYIMSDNALSPVFNIRGTKNIPTLENLFDDKVGYTKYIDEDKTPLDLLYTDNTLLERTLIKVDEESYRITSGKSIFENAKGVIQIDDLESTQEMVYGIGIFIPLNIIEYLRTTHKIKGFFLVRQKRIPTILAQAYTLPRDPVALVPLLRYGTDDNPNYAIERFLSDDAILTLDYKKRLYTKYSDTTLSLLYTSNELTAICPEFEVQQSYFNQFFTGTSYPVKTVPLLPDMLLQSNINNRFYYADFPETSGGTVESQNMTSAKIVSITDDVPLVAIEDTIYRGVLGSAEEAFRFRYAEIENRGKVKVPVLKKVFGATVTVQEEREPTNLVRGIFSPYLGMISANNIKPNKVVNIYIPGYSKGVMSNYFKIRYEDDSPYYPINGRISLSKFSNDWDTRTSGDYVGYTTECYRGDCYICNFTHRLNRNFQDPSAPMNDEIVDQNTWKENYSSESTDNFDKINRGDVNAVQLGSWITVRLRTSRNLSIRSSDSSNAGEMGLAGVPRGFYPLQQLTVHGNYKIPSSYLINGGFGKTTGEKLFFTLPDVPYIKNNFENRILYSDIAVNDAYRNGYRVFRSTTFNDYKKEYGSIIRILELHNGILCVFEHAIAFILVNERTAISEGGNGVFINSANVLPENILIISDMLGSLWQESVIKTPYYVYGVDTVAKKIWRTNGQSIEILSDFKMNKFLIDNITLSERETTPIIGIRNVKTHYNANKGDVMFTFYDNTYGFEEKVWNLCFNETFNGKGGFITFYSWVPSYSANIDNIFFSYNRKTSKYIAKLGTSLLGSDSADGVVVRNSVIGIRDNGKIENYDNIILNDNSKLYFPRICTYIPKNNGLVNRILPTLNNKLDINISYYLCKDNFLNYKYFKYRLNNNVEEELTKQDDTWNLSLLNNTDDNGYLLRFLPDIKSLPTKVNDSGDPNNKYSDINNTVGNANYKYYDGIHPNYSNIKNTEFFSEDTILRNPPVQILSLDEKEIENYNTFIIDLKTFYELNLLKYLDTTIKSLYTLNTNLINWHNSTIGPLTTAITLGNLIEVLNLEISVLESDIATKTSEINLLTIEINTLDNEISTLTTEINNLNNNYINPLTSEINSLTNDITLLNNEIASLTTQINALNAEVSTPFSISTLESKINTLSDEIANLNIQILELDDLILTLDSDIIDLQEEIANYDPSESDVTLDYLRLLLSDKQLEQEELTLQRILKSAIRQDKITTKNAYLHELEVKIQLQSLEAERSEKLSLKTQKENLKATKESELNTKISERNSKVDSKTTKLTTSSLKASEKATKESEKASLLATLNIKLTERTDKIAQRKALVSTTEQVPENSTLSSWKDVHVDLISKLTAINTWISEKVYPYWNYIKALTEYKLEFGNLQDLFNSKEVWLLNIKAKITVNTKDGVEDTNIIQYKDNWSNNLYNFGQYDSIIALTSEKVFNNPLLSEEDRKMPNLSTDFWKHGLSGIIDIKEDIKPTYWYGKQHPFEFEFVVRDTPNMHKIFNNLEIVSNKAEPESFHFEIVGESYEFADDKPNMYYRLELTKKLFLNLGSDILYNRNYVYITPKLRPIYDVYMRPSGLYDKSTIFPLYYKRVDTFEEIYDSYVKMDGSGKSKDYKNLSGSEITWNKDLNEFRIWTHIGNYPIDKFGRMRGNSHYLEDRWKIQIPSIVFALKNEEEWNDGKPPIVINGVPEDVTRTTISNEDLSTLLSLDRKDIYEKMTDSEKLNLFGNTFNVNTKFEELSLELLLEIQSHILDRDRVKSIYSLDDIDIYKTWTYRKEAKIKDKYVKIRIRYTGDLLAVITAVLTLYTESYA